VGIVAYWFLHKLYRRLRARGRCDDPDGRITSRCTGPCRRYSCCRSGAARCRPGR
jgi:hypothetical protein